MKFNVKEELAAVAECIDCGWKYQYTGESRLIGQKALRAARAHAGSNGHRTIAHRSTAFDPQITEPSR